MHVDEETTEQIWNLVERYKEKVKAGIAKFPGKEEIFKNAVVSAFKKELDAHLLEMNAADPVRAHVISAGFIRVAIPLIKNTEEASPSMATAIKVVIEAAITEAKETVPSSLFNKTQDKQNTSRVIVLRNTLLSRALNVVWGRDDVLDQLSSQGKRSVEIKPGDKIDDGLYFLQKSDASDVAFFAKDNGNVCELFRKKISEIDPTGSDSHSFQLGYRYRVRPGQRVPRRDLAPQQGASRKAESSKAPEKAKKGKGFGHG